jgi:hypothetical protein
MEIEHTDIEQEKYANAQTHNQYWADGHGGEFPVRPTYRQKCTTSVPDVPDKDDMLKEALDMGMVTIEDDRYGETGYGWLAWRCGACDVPVYDINDDEGRAEFWRNYTGIVGKGNTPNDALLDLYNKVKEYQSR